MSRDPVAEALEKARGAIDALDQGMPVTAARRMKTVLATLQRLKPARVEWDEMWDEYAGHWPRGPLYALTDEQEGSTDG